MSGRNTHNRLLDHFGSDLDTNLLIDGDVGTTTSGSTVHQALLDLYDDIGTISGGGGSITVEDGTTTVTTVTQITVGEVTDDGSGAVTIFPQITGTGDGTLHFFSTSTGISSPSGDVVLNALDQSSAGLRAYIYADHTAGDFADKGVDLAAGFDAVGINLSEKDSSTVQIYADDSGGYDIELKDRGTSHWKTVSADGSTSRDLIDDTTLDGVTISGTPANGDVLTATGTDTATWQATPSASSALAIIVNLTNESGASVAAGDVVILDTANDESFVTTTTASAANTLVGVAQETIASTASGKIALAGYVSLVNVGSSVTRGQWAFTASTAKEAAASSTFASGAFGMFLSSGATPSAYLYGYTTPSVVLTGE